MTPDDQARFLRRADEWLHDYDRTPRIQVLAGIAAIVGTLLALAVCFA